MYLPAIIFVAVSKNLKSPLTLIGWSVFFVLTGLLVVWVLVGAGFIFGDSDCKNCIHYVDGYSLWAICTAICGLWLGILGIASIAAVSFGITRLIKTK
jgi:hypothetical protein